MNEHLSRMTILAGIAAGSGGLVSGCNGIPLGSPSGSSGEGDAVRLEYIEVWNRTETAHAATITVARDGETVHTETLDIGPPEGDQHGTLENLYGPYLDPNGDYEVELEVGDLRQSTGVYREGATDSECYRVVTEILLSDPTAEADYVLAANAHSDEAFCDYVEDRLEE